MGDADPNGQVREQDARNLAGAFLFSGAEQEKTLDVLSGGERARMVLAGLVACPMNLLVLDEPSNHLDIPSAERLEQALVNYGDAKDGRGGALVLISHDRALIEATCTTLVVFEEGEGPRIFNGTFSQWDEADRRRGDAKPAEPETKRSPKDAKSGRRRKDRGRTSTPRRDGPDLSGLAKLSTSKIESRIEEIETRIREIDETLMDPEAYRDGKRMRRLQTERTNLAGELEPLEFEWSTRASED